MENKTVLIGLSGGVDSAVVALLLKQQGYNVIGAFMKNFSETKNKMTGDCTWVEEKKSAQKVAAHLGIKFVSLDFEKEYKKYVIDPMFKSYKAGYTPNPDILCNKIIKFPLLWKAARKYKADYMATGHYARIKKTKSGFSLISGKDKTKDQSYFLSELNQEDLKHTLFPLGNYTKEQVRQIAKKHKLHNWAKKGTRGICFVGKIDIQQFLKKRIKPKQGLVLDPKGKKIGTHPGIFYFTIGQRIGPRLNIKTTKHLEDKWYIAEKKKPNTIIIAPKRHKSLKKKQIYIKSLHLVNPSDKIPKTNIKARIRHLGPLNSGTLKKQKGKYIFILKKPIEQVAEGQSIVLYKGQRLIGGGEIRLK